MKKLLLCVLLSTFSMILSGQENEKDITDYETMSMVGMVITSANGMGITYRYIKEKNCISVSFTPSFGELDILAPRSTNLGINYIRYFRKSKKVDFSIIFGGEYVHKDYARYFDQSLTKETSISIGLGPQINMRIVPEITLEMGFGYGIYRIGSKEGARSNISAGLGVFYNIYH